MDFYGLADFFFPEVNERADNGQLSSVKICYRGKGVELSRVQKAHQKGFHGIVMMVGIGDFIYAMLCGVAVDGAPAEKRAGIAGIFVRCGGDGAGDIHINDIVGYAQPGHKAPGSVNVKERWASLFIFEQGIDGQGGQFKILLQPLLQYGHGIGQKNAVLAAGNAQKDVVAILYHIKFHNGAHKFTVVMLRHI